MKKILLILVLLLVVSGCSKDDRPVLRVYNWGAYIDEDVLTDFEDAFDVKIQYDLFFSNEDMYTKLASESYDILIPSDYMIQRLIEEDRIQKLDFSKIPNAKNIDPMYTHRDFDKNNEYSAAYLSGSVGLVYKKSEVLESEITSKGWDILRDPKYRDNVFYYDSERDGFMVALKALGYSMNSDNLDEINEAYEWMVAMKKEVNPIFVDDYVIDAMEAGEKAIAVMYSGDATYVLSENDDLAFIEPHQGTNIWLDAMVIPTDAKNVDIAHQFINFVLSNENQYRISASVGDTSPIKSVADAVHENEYKGINSYIPREGYEKDEEFYYNAKIKPVLGDLWSKVTATN